MKQIDLGRSGLLGSEIALGCMRINKLGEKELDAYIRTALDCGVTFFDHADIYGGGDCEAAFGQVLQNEPSLRDKMVLQGKCGIRPGMLRLLQRAHPEKRRRHPAAPAHRPPGPAPAPPARRFDGA